MPDVFGSAIHDGDQAAQRYQDTWLGMRIADASGGNLVIRGDGSPQTPEAESCAVATVVRPTDVGPDIL